MNWLVKAFEAVTGYTWHRKLRRESGEVYMDRWQLIKSGPLCVYVNRINMPDYDDLPHNHPWPRAYSLKLRRGYWEEVYEKASVVFARLSGTPWPYEDDGLIPLLRRPGRWNRIPKVHRITRVDPGGAWTLFIGLNRWSGGDKAWGFVRPDGTVIPADQRKAERGVVSES